MARSLLGYCIVDTSATSVQGRIVRANLSWAEAARALESLPDHFVMRLAAVPRLQAHNPNPPRKGAP